MNKKLRDRYNRARGIAEYILEGHNVREAEEEFRLTNKTIWCELRFLRDFGYDYENLKNKTIYRLVLKKLKIIATRNKQR